MQDGVRNSTRLGLSGRSFTGVYEVQIAVFVGRQELAEVLQGYVPRRERPR